MILLKTEKQSHPLDFKSSIQTYSQKVILGKVNSRPRKMKLCHQSEMVGGGSEYWKIESLT